MGGTLPARCALRYLRFKQRTKKQGDNGFEQGGFYYPGKEAAMVIIVVSLPCTAYLCGALIVLQKSLSCEL